MWIDLICAMNFGHCYSQISYVWCESCNMHDMIENGFRLMWCKAFSWLIWFGGEGFGTGLSLWVKFWVMVVKMWWKLVYKVWLMMYIEWYWLKWILAWIVVVLVCDQRRTSAIFAQASPSRLSESCRVSFWVLVRVFRLGNLCQDWATNTLAWAREARLSEVAMKLVRVERDFSSRRGVLRCWATDNLA